MAPLTDAALTPYHAIKRALPHLTPDVAVVVLGLGGLGHMAVQLFRVLAPVRVIAADIDTAKLEQAKKLGAHDVIQPATRRQPPNRSTKLLALEERHLCSIA